MVGGSAVGGVCRQWYRYGDDGSDIGMLGVGSGDGIGGSGMTSMVLIVVVAGEGEVKMRGM